MQSEAAGQQKYLTEHAKKTTVSGAPHTSSASAALAHEHAEERTAFIVVGIAASPAVLCVNMPYDRGQPLFS